MVQTEYRSVGVVNHCTWYERVPSDHSG